MSTSGWIFLIISWTLIIGLCLFCFRVIFEKKEKNIVYPLDVESHLEEIEDAEGHNK